MIYTKEVENMCKVAKGVDHGPAPIPEEGKWVQAKEIKDISGLTHGIGWCAPQQGACKLTLNIKEGIIYSTEKLSNEDIENVEKKFKEILSNDVELENQIDEKLIGGYKVVIEDKVFDGSIKNKLEFMKLSLKQGGRR